jgi:hypothetical protein
MQKRQKSWSNMYKTVVANANDPANKPVTDSVITLKQAIALLASLIQRITLVATQQLTGITGAAELKKYFKLETCNACFVIIQPALAFCKATNNPVLAAKIRFSLTQLIRFDDSIFVDKMNSIKDALQPYITDESLLDYNVTPAMWSAFTAAIDNYQSVETSPRSAIVTRKSETQQLKALFAQANDHCKNTLDKIVGSMRFTHPDYYNSYMDSRRIVNQPTITTKLKAIVLDAITGQPLPMAIITISNTEQSAMSNISGKAVINQVKIGMHTVTCTAEGFQTTTSPVLEFKKGKYTTVKFLLQPESITAGFADNKVLAN